MFAVRLRRKEHTRRYSISPWEQGGWEVTREEDRELTHRVCYHDWHRVENAMMRFAIQSMQLENAGWTEIHTPASSVV